MLCRIVQYYLHEVLIMIIERLPIFSVVKGRHTDYLFFLVDDWQRQDIFYGPSAVIQRLWLGGQTNTTHPVAVLMLSVEQLPDQLETCLSPETGTSHQQLHSWCYKSEEQKTERVDQLHRTRESPACCKEIERETHKAALSNIGGQAALQGPMFWRWIAVWYMSERQVIRSGRRLHPNLFEPPTVMNICKYFPFYPLLPLEINIDTQLN